MRKSMMAMALAASLLAGCERKEAGPANTQAPTTPGLTPAPAQAPAAPPPAGPVLGQASDTKSELRMEVTEAARAGGVLTVKTRFTFVAGKPGMRSLPGSAAADVYVTAGDKKYLLLKDDHDKELMSSASYPSFDQVGSTQSWWGKFPAPAPDVKAVNFYFSGFEPVENVALTDR